MALKNLHALLAKRGPGWNLSKLAKATGISKSTLSGISAGTGAIRLDHLRKIAEALEVSVHQLAYGEPDPFEAQSSEILHELFRGDVRVILQRIEKKGNKK